MLGSWSIRVACVLAQSILAAAPVPAPARATGRNMRCWWACASTTPTSCAACRTPRPTSPRSTESLESVTRPQVLKPPGGVSAFFSCSEGEKAFEHADLKHGVFFHFVIEALKGAAVGPEEREVFVPDLEKYVKRRVREKYG